jgi:signal transduction histidine kinase
MAQPIPAAFAFFAFGALFLSSVLLLLFNPRSRGVRWFLLFQVANLVWLGAQGWAFAADDWPRVAWIVMTAVHMMPAIFIGYALVEGRNVPLRTALLPIVLGAALLPLPLGALGMQIARWFNPVWHIAGWGVGTLLLTAYLTRRREESAPGGAPPRVLSLAVGGLFFVIAPSVLVGAILLGQAMFFYAMPLIVVWIQILIFVGVAHLRFYDIEVRAARTGELAAGAAEADRLAIMGELTASLAHEIRNPLTGVRSLAQRLAEEEIDEPSRRRYAGVILEEVGRVERLVANLLGLVKRGPAQKTRSASTPLGPLYEDLALLLASRAARADVRLVVHGGDLVVHAPREVLAQALLNLLLNAIDHSPPGAAVYLMARTEEAAIELTVRDSGPGIAREDRERVWQPFHSTSGGTGLGLAVVRRLAREQGWEIGLGDAPGGGAEFSIRIPLPAVSGASTASPAILIATER